jgi:beta-mannosidase
VSAMTDPIEERNPETHGDRAGPRRHDLSSGWTVELTSPSTEAPRHLQGRQFLATVPGVVHTDLLRAESISDPLRDSVENEVQWIGRSDWR